MNNDVKCSLDFTHISGRRMSADFLAGSDEQPWPGSPFSDRLLRVTGSDWQQRPSVPGELRQRRLVTPPASDDWAPYDLVDNEIRIGLHLVRTFGTASYPAELSQIFGYDADGDEPFLLLLPYIGEPVEAVAGRMQLIQERGFETSFFRALRLLEVAEVVHGGINPATVRWYWDGSSARVQLVDFSNAALAGEPRPGPGQRPWAPPGALTPAGRAELGDDVWSAGLLTYHVITGRPVKPNGEAPDLSGRDAPGRDLSGRDALLSTLLDGVFAKAAADRPTAARLLELLPAPDPWPEKESPPETRFDMGARRFDELARRKSPQAGETDERSTIPPSAPGKRRVLTVICLIIVALIAVVVLVALEV